METSANAPEQKVPRSTCLIKAVVSLSEAVDRLEGLAHWIKNGDAPATACEKMSHSEATSVVQVLDETPGVIEHQTERILELGSEIREMLS